MSQTIDLLTLQEIDDEIASLRAAFASVASQLEGDEELNDARRLLLEAEQQLAAIHKRHRQIEGEVEDLTAKIEPEEKRLYSGSVKSPKELESIQHEVELLKRTRNTAEDQLLDVMSALEAAQQERDQLAGTVAEHERRWEHEQQELRREARRLEDAIALQETKREQQQHAIPPRSLALYEDLRRRKGGVAAVRLKSGACSGCRVGVPEVVRKRVLSPAQLAQCPNCERILSAG